VIYDAIMAKQDSRLPTPESVNNANFINKWGGRVFLIGIFAIGSVGIFMFLDNPDPFSVFHPLDSSSSSQRSVPVVGEPAGLASENILPVVYCPNGAKHTDENPTESGKWMALEGSSSRYLIRSKDGLLHQCQKNLENPQDLYGKYVVVTPTPSK
jgi:hypothetical protein